MASDRDLGRRGCKTSGQPLDDREAGDQQLGDILPGGRSAADETVSPDAQSVEVLVEAGYRRVVGVRDEDPGPPALQLGGDPGQSRLIIPVEDACVPLHETV